MTSTGQYNCVRKLYHGVIESLCHTAAPHAGENAASWIAGCSTVESEKEQPRTAVIAVCDPKLLRQIAYRICKSCAVTQLHVINTNSRVVQKSGAESVTPIDYFVVNWSIRSKCASKVGGWDSVVTDTASVKS